MIKRIVIAGSRDYNDYKEAEAFIKQCLEALKPFQKLIILSGGCTGADQLGERFAKENGYLIELHKAKWAEYGKAAGPIRNRKMAENCDAVICFWDQKSRGTASMISFAKKYEKSVFIKQI